MAYTALGKHHREGISLIELMDMFPDEKATNDWLIARRWPDGIICPHCGHN